MELDLSTRNLIERELETDHAGDDVTTRCLGEKGFVPALATVIAKEAGVFSGESVVEAFRALTEGKMTWTLEARDGESVTPGRELLAFRGTFGACLSIERTLLNLLCHLSGVATLTRRYVEAVKPHATKILPTRKTLPGLRGLQLTAVQAGGGTVHRRSLSDGILIKENHLMGLGEQEILDRARSIRSPLHRVEIEVQSLGSLERVLEKPPEVIMLDNLPLEVLAEAVRRIGGRAAIEVSGGIQVEQCQAIAALGVDYISVGALTHSVRALDLSLDIALE